MNVLEDPLVQKMIMRKDLSTDRIKTYSVVLTDYCNLIELNPTEAILEAKEEQIPYLNKKQQIIFPDVEERKIAFYQIQYNQHLKDKNMSDNTRKSYLMAVRAFYRENNVELPKPITVNVERIIIKEGTIPKIEDVRKALEFSNKLRNKAIILLMATTGLRTKDIRNFNIEDFTYATREYHDGETIHDLLNLKDNHIENIIPAWFIIPSKTKKKDRSVCLTFNTPECTQAIIDYLRSREDLKETDPLFEAYGRRMTKSTYSTLLEQLNDNVFKKVDSKGHRFFRAHNLRKFFLSQYRQNTNDLFYLKLVAGHALPGVNDENYQEIPIGPAREEYMKVILALSVRDTEVHNIKSKEYLALERKNQEYEERDEERAKENQALKDEMAEFKKEMYEMIKDSKK